MEGFGLGGGKRTKNGFNGGGGSREIRCTGQRGDRKNFQVEIPPPLLCYL